MSLDLLRTRRARRQSGVGMVEVMVAMVLGAMVVIGVIQVFTANRQTFRMQDGMAITQEAGTFALEFIGRDLLRAGRGNGSDLDPDSAFEWANTSDGGAVGNDRIAILYEATAADSRYCTGEVADVDRISNRYWVNAQDELVCQGARFTGAAYVAVGTPQVIVDNVESFQVLFGVDTHHENVDVDLDGVADTDCPTATGEPTLYVPASRVVAAINRGAAMCPPLDAGGVAGEMVQTASTVVRTVRIALLLRTENQAGVVVPAERRYAVLDQDLGEPTINPADGRLRRLFTKTVGMRNFPELKDL